MADLHADYFEAGFVHLKEGIPGGLLRRLQEDLSPLIEGRDSGKTSLDWRHQTILEPAHFRRSFVDFLEIDALNDTARAMIGTDDLSFIGLAVLLGRKVNSFCRWHRDFGESDPEIAGLLANPTMMIQFNAAVFEDRSLWVVPGSHRRASLPGERAYAERFDKLEFTGPMDAALKIADDPIAAMPGAQHVVLQAGDCLLYNPILWHAAEYRPEWKRATLHGGWRNAAKVEEFRALRWGLDHNPWLMEPGYLGELGPNFRPQLERFQRQVKKHVTV